MNSNVDILLAVYNGEMYLEEQLCSIKEQTYKNIRLLVRDDGSSDGSIRIIEKFAEVLNVKIIRDQMGSLGAAGNFSALLQYSDAEYVLFCDQDDVWQPNKVELSIGAIKDAEGESGGNKPLLVFTDLSVIDSSGCLIHPSLLKWLSLDPAQCTFQSLLVQNPAWGCTMCINRSLISLIKNIPQGAYLHDRWVMLVAAAFGEIVFLPYASVRYRRHNSNVSTVKPVNALSFKVVLNKILYARHDLDKLSKQAACFCEHYQHLIGQEEKKSAEFLANISKYPFFARKSGIIKNRLFYHGAMKKLAQLILW